MTAPDQKIRLDLLLTQRGLAVSRSKAQALVAEGKVFCGDHPLTKSSELVDWDIALELRGATEQFASRGGLKLDAAIKHFNVDCRGKTGVDIGASTGGFTDVLLHHGADKIYAVDVGEGQLIDRLRTDRRVIMIEKVNARYITRDILPEDFQILVCDVSFISLTKALPAVMQLAPENCVLIALIKPQFEVGAGNVGKGGIVKDPVQHDRVCAEIQNWLADEMGWQVDGIMNSPIDGQDGNREFLIAARKSRIR